MHFYQHLVSEYIFYSSPCSSPISLRRRLVGRFLNRFVFTDYDKLFVLQLPQEPTLNQHGRQLSFSNNKTQNYNGDDKTTTTYSTGQCNLRISPAGCLVISLYSQFVHHLSRYESNADAPDESSGTSFANVKFSRNEYNTGVPS